MRAESEKAKNLLRKLFSSFILYIPKSGILVWKLYFCLFVYKVRFSAEVLALWALLGGLGRKWHKAPVRTEFEPNIRTVYFKSFFCLFCDFKKVNFLKRTFSFVLDDFVLPRPFLRLHFFSLSRLVPITFVGI